MKLGIGVHTPDSISPYYSTNAAEAWYSAVLRKTNQIITSYFSMQSHAEWRKNGVEESAVLQMKRALLLLENTR